jgi:chloramphenicol-sensitive protein RarD
LKQGVFFALAAYIAWGVLPIYWKALQTVPAGQIMTHRVIWSLFFLVLLISLKKNWEAFRLMINPRVMLTYLLAGCLLGVNWLIYIWGVNAGFIVETSLGYFINPLVSVVLGVIFFREKLALYQWVPVGLAGLGVVYLSISYGSLPWIALALAFSFGFYGLIKKMAPLNSLHGLTLETAVLFLPALIYLLFMERSGVGAFGHSYPSVHLLLILSGVVTTIPLLLFASAARRIPLSMVGFIQYIAPTIQFLIGVLIYNEPFTQARMVGFSMVWLALVIYTAGSVWDKRRAQHIKKQIRIN